MDQLIHPNPADLRESPLQYRRRKGDPKKFDELVESAKTHGILEPVVARTVKERGKEVLELVFGHRRRAAAVKAGCATIPTLLKVLTDIEVREHQLVENGPREDAHPLDEAEAFSELTKLGRSPAQIAERIGKPVSYIAQRLKLLKLAKPVLEALGAEKITLTVATLIARVPDAKLQAQILGEVEGSEWEPGMKADEVRALLEERYLLRLDQAPFDITSASLVPKAGACTACPKRTGNQRELFPDVKSADLCTDPVCHRSKLDALWAIRVKEADAGGTPVLDGKAGHDAATNHYSGKYVGLDVKNYASGKERTTRSIIAKAKPPTLLARDDQTGQIVEVVARADVEKILDAGRKDTKTNRAEDDYKAKAKREAAKTKVRRKAIDQALLLATLSASKLDPLAVLALVVRGYASEIWDEHRRAILVRRGLEAKGQDSEGRLRKLARDCEKVKGDTLGLALELAMQGAAPWHGPNGGGRGGADVWSDALKLAGVDFAKIEKGVAESEKERKATKGKGKADGVVHLADSRSDVGTACGAMPGTGVGSGLTTNTNRITCRNCLHAGGPQIRAAKAKKKPKAKRKAGRK